MSLARISPRRLPEDERRAHILEAAERAFVRLGFHAATMSQVADEAGMSAGNLYRYFPSKEAIVEGLCLSEEKQRSEAFAALAGVTDLKAAMYAELKAHVLNCPRAKAQLIVEIWAESGRNARIAEITRRLDRDVRCGLVELFDLAKVAGVAAKNVDSQFAARLMFSLVDGVFKRVALDPKFDPEAESAMVLGVFDAVFEGAIAPRAEV